MCVEELVEGFCLVILSRRGAVGQIARGRYVGTVPEPREKLISVTLFCFRGPQHKFQRTCFCRGGIESALWLHNATGKRWISSNGQI